MSAASRTLGAAPDPTRFESREEFAAGLTVLRNRAGLTVREVAKLTDIPAGTIGDYFRGQSLPRTTPYEPGEPVPLTVILRVCGVTDAIAQLHWAQAADRLRPTRGPRPAGAPDPYPGLRAFQTEDADWFFGREQLTSELVGELADRYRRGGILVVLGVSGAGKSSLLRAGLIPALCRGDLGEPGSADWPWLLFTPGEHPLEELAARLAEKAGTTSAAAAELLWAGPRAAADLARRASAVPGDPTATAGSDRRLVVVVDQFEEVFTSCADEAEQVAFIAALWAAAGGSPAGGGEAEGDGCAPPALVVVGLRADFYYHVLRRADLMPALESRHVLVGPMTEEELRAVVAKPAAKENIRLEDGLVELLLRDLQPPTGPGNDQRTGGRGAPVVAAAHEPGALPLLAHALNVTWDRRLHGRMTVAEYQASGGIQGAVAQTAEDAYAELENAGQADAVRQLFLRLVHIGDDTADARRRVSREELIDSWAGDRSEELAAVLRQFVDRRLVTVDSDGVEIAHESVLSAWPRLRGWIDADRVGLVIRHRLTDAARGWLESGRDPDLLVRGGRLRAAQGWARDPAHRGALNHLEQEFLTASVQRHEAEQRAARRWKSVRRVLVGTLAVLFLFATGTATFAFVQAKTAGRERDEAQSRSLASFVRTLRGKDISLARQLALIAYDISPTTEARSALIDATALRPAVRMLGDAKGDAGILYAVGIHPGGTIVAAATEGTVRFWDVSDPGHPTPRPALPGAGCSKIYALAFSPDGNLLAASCRDGSIHLWDTHDPMVPTELPALTGLGAKVYSVAFSPDGSMMAAAIAEPTVDGVTPGSVRLWQVSGDTPRPLGGPLRISDTSPAKSISFHPDNDFLAVGTDDGTVQVWDISTPEHPANPVPAVGATKAIGQLAFSPDGRRLAAGGADFLVHLWSTVDPRNPVPDGAPIGGSSTYVNAVAFSPDGGTLAIASSDANVGVRLVDLTSDDHPVTATMPHPSAVTSVKFSPDGTKVISGANDGTARVWPAASTTLEGFGYTVSATRFSPGGDTLAIGSADLRFLDVADPQHPRPLGPALTNLDHFSGTVAFAPNKRLLAEGHGKSGTVQLWNVTDPARPVPLGPPLQAHRQQVETVTFSPDSTVLVTGSRDGAVHLWDVRTPEAPVQLSTPGTFGGYVSEVFFSPDGKLLAAGSTDKTIRLWNVSNPRSPIPVGGTFTPANHYVLSTVFSPDGTMLAVSLADSTVRLYDVTNPAHLTPIGKPLTGPEGYVNFVSFSTDGTALAGTAADGTVSIWELHGHDQPSSYATLTLGAGAMYPVNYQPQSHLLVAGNDEKKAWIWTTDTDAAAALVCDTSGDAITREEWEKYVPGRSYDPPCV